MASMNRSGCACSACSYTPIGGPQAVWNDPVRMALPSPASSQCQSPSEVSHLVPQLLMHQSYQLGTPSLAHFFRSFSPRSPVNVFLGMGCRTEHNPLLSSSFNLV